MVNKGSFHGAREEFLLAQAEEYATAVQNNHVSDTISSILRRFLKRFPIDLPDSYEPTSEQLAAVDDNAADEPMSDLESMSSSDSEDDQPGQEARVSSKANAKKVRKEKLTFRRHQIKRWLKYRYQKQYGGKKPKFNPYQAFLPTFLNLINQKAGKSKKSTPKARRRPPLNLWRQTKRTEIEHQFQIIAAQAEQLGQPIPSTHYATRREAIARELFNSLSKEDQLYWQQAADREYDELVAKENEADDGKIPTDPAARQRAIQHLAAFIQPILDLICDLTGWKATFIAGGPEPAKGGQISIINVHSGVTTGDVPMNFGRAERAAYKTQIMPIYGRFLKGCYSPQECRSRALDPQVGLLPVADFNNEDEDIYSLPNNNAPSSSARNDTIVERPPTSTLSDGENGNDSSDSETSESENPFPNSMRLPVSLPPSPTASPRHSPVPEARLEEIVSRPSVLPSFLGFAHPTPTHGSLAAGVATPPAPSMTSSSVPTTSAPNGPTPAAHSSTRTTPSSSRPTLAPIAESSKATASPTPSSFYAGVVGNEKDLNGQGAAVGVQVVKKKKSKSATKSAPKPAANLPTPSVAKEKDLEAAGIQAIKKKSKSKAKSVSKPAGPTKDVQVVANGTTTSSLSAGVDVGKEKELEGRGVAVGTAADVQVVANGTSTKIIIPGKRKASDAQLNQIDSLDSQQDSGRKKKKTEQKQQNTLKEGLRRNRTKSAKAQALDKLEQSKGSKGKKRLK